MLLQSYLEDKSVLYLVIVKIPFYCPNLELSGVESAYDCEECKSWMKHVETIQANVCIHVHQ